MVILFRLLLLIAIAFIVYSAIKYVFHPRRKLEQAHERRQYFFLDEEKNVRKNFLLTYKGVMFEGEKYLGTTEQSFEIVSIYIWARDTERLKGLHREDFEFIEEDIRLRYPNAKIEWKSPIKEFLKK
ncbi:sigma-w pathway protein ysdB [Alkalihalophilus marmarensis]|uniref:sigma-w pathway protein ysdB n=1 Tax=Alkalihalophilus marmarensis TaxID=521377 RepID=UPI002DBFF49D|nr:sigma-w pathway protein ysdB [Alkalihalophilus marmarensis]MEC2071693.1 sigma-w pathway protein ysdB [Alkalihalophilus marmarensis]